MSDEDFSLVLEPSEETLEGLRALIQNEKDKLSQLEQEQKDLDQSIRETQNLTQQFRVRTQNLQQDLDLDQIRTKDQEAQDQEQLELGKQEEQELKMELEQVYSELSEEEAKMEKLRARVDVFSGAPERSVVFCGHTERPGKGPLFNMEPLVEYPMEGGTAFIIFEEEEVAQRILSMHKHKVDLGGEFHLNVEVRPVSIILPSSVQVQAQVCPRRILVSCLPQMDKARLEDKLYIHFSQAKNGGGAVDEWHVQEESGTAVITFMQDNIAKGLTDVEFHDVKLSEGTNRVRVTPFINGNVTDLQTRFKLCQRTVLLTGIPDIADPETLQDLLEIHFQKKTSGGGEIEAILYCPVGQTRTALFHTPQKDK
ncbi:interferon-induced protein 35 isoform X1 [Periophthalmus magnuspinnatus]|uniref:interferon-induced protein 35 isoform X1 n=1 Tax=Periophthalmus magnuspinnatus TaxID=409849 RepID=UPI00145A3006|nr:interferon-induced protein 35 isoform X1 [Periophthalmus magnuspinnatus]